MPSVHACLFSFVRKKETACDTLRFYSAGSRSPFVRSRGVGAVICLGGFTSGLCVYFWRSRRVTGDAGTGERAGGAALVRFCAVTLALKCFPRGVTLGLRAPDCAKESSTLWTLLTLRRGWVGAYSPRRHPGTRKDLTGSDLWPVRSCCTAMISMRTIVQTRAALKRRGVGLHAR